MYRPTSIPELIADINIKNYGELIYATAVGINPDDDKEYEKLGRVRSKKYLSKRTESAIKECLAKLEERFITQIGEKPATEKDMRSAFAALKAKVFDDHFKLHRDWEASSTNENAIKYYEGNVLPSILPFADPNKKQFLPCDREEIERKLIKKAENRSNKDTRENGDDYCRSKAIEIVRRHLRSADIIYAHLRDINPRLPPIRLSSAEPFVTVPKPEQIKFLSHEILMRFYQRLEDLVYSDPKHVFFTVFVIFGARPAEAAARKPSDLVWCKNYVTAQISSQEQAGKLNPKLKNRYSRRVMIIPWWGSVLLKKCCDRIGDDYPHDDKAMNDTTECAAWVKELLLECGCDDSVFSDAEQSITSDDLDTGDKNDNSHKLESSKISCYVLRRVFTTIARSTMGLTMIETDRLLGHVPIGSKGKNPKHETIDLNAIDNQAAIAAKMERYIFDPKYSLNPSCTPYKLTCHESISMIAFSTYTIVNNASEAKTLSFNIEAAETGESIIIRSSEINSQSLEIISTPKSWDHIDRTVIGETTFQEGGNKDGKKEG